MIQVKIKHVEFYACFWKEYNAQTDNWYEKGLRIRLGKYAYVSGKGWRNWTKDK